MKAPVFEEFDPASDCDCPGCLHWRSAARSSPSSLTIGLGGHPAAHGARRALVLAAAAGTVIGGAHAVPAVAADHGPARPGVPFSDEPPTPQGGSGPLHGPVGRPASPLGRVTGLPATTRAAIVNRAKLWLTAKVPYSMVKYWSDGYRQDCSGFVSMAWNLGSNEWTGSLGKFGTRITRDQLQPGDMLLFHNLSDPQKGSHVVLFGGWTDYTHTYYLAYEQTPPSARKQSTPYAYWSNSSHYVPYRYKGLKVEEKAAVGGSVSTQFPGVKSFGSGANNANVTRLGKLLVGRGGGRFYTVGPGPRWGAADRLATQAFQRAQGWTGANADGLPGPTTWAYLVGGKGKNIPPVAGGASGPGSATSKVPPYPGRGMFRPGASNAHVTQLGRQLVKKGFGKNYTKDPGPRWGEDDRRGVEAFQRSQGWRGGAADGYPGPETWRRLFS
ncbi:peptidoglycan-binding protein [Streptomyces sp. NPDC001939]|uniref:peptidoglycan-binding protein n=1 Tax=Streptomyces TaxID=1883 RepID=UPI001D09C7C8|nr:MULTISPECIES: peptidoglycan-binding protein [Streptomyces]MCX5081933.1 peptidoglycan-binding protein [Streptomyces sp. NBC_00401]UDM00143.1 peptidoglycan-binding protein [Streptomyces longhuiensis]